MSTNPATAAPPPAARTAASTPPARRRRPAGRGRPAAGLLRSHGIALALLVLVSLVAVGDPTFLSPANLVNMLGQWAPAGIMAVAMTYVVIARGFDLSIASGFSFCAIVAAIVAESGQPNAVAFGAAVAAGAAIGLFNGVLVAGLAINPFIATVGTGFILLGLDIILTPGAYITVTSEGFDALGSGTWLGVPIKGIILVAALVIGEVVLQRTRFGQSLFAIGGNPEAARLSGLKVRTLTCLTYVGLGVATGIAGLLAASQLSSAQARMEPTIVFDVIAIVVLGGTSLAGGSGAIWRTAVGLAIIATISNGFTLLGLNPFYQSIVKGAVILAAVALEGWAQRTSAAALSRAAAADEAATRANGRTAS